VPRPASADIDADRLVVSIPHPTTQYEECVKRRMVTTFILAEGSGRA